MKTKTRTLAGPDLNRAVAMALGCKVYRIVDPIDVINKMPEPKVIWVQSATDTTPTWLQSRSIPDYAGDITQAWPIMKAWHIDLCHIQRSKSWMARFDRAARGAQPPVLMRDPDPQIAAMRCFVASVYGDEVELP